MKCPFKRNVLIEKKGDVTTKETYFGECEKIKCMAYTVDELTDKSYCKLLGDPCKIS